MSFNSLILFDLKMNYFSTMVYFSVIYDLSGRELKDQGDFSDFTQSCRVKRSLSLSSVAQGLDSVSR